MKKYEVTSTQDGAMSQLDSMLQQLRDKARKAPGWKATTTPVGDSGKETSVTFTLAIDLPPPG